MRILTDRYNEARERGAKPLVYAYVESDQAMRCFGKETPREAHLDESLAPLEWSSRVLIFGDFRQSLTEDSGNVYQSLFQKEMDTYTLTLDNADGYFSELLGAEIFLKQRLVLVQGFDFPGCTSADFPPLFNGIISDIALSNLQCVLTADQAILPVVPEDPAVDTTKIYSMTDDGTGTMASENFTFDELEDVFFAEESWTLTTEIIRETTLTQETLFKLVNDTYGSTRLEVGIDATDHPYITYTEDAGTVTPTYNTITADFTLGLGAHTIQYTWDNEDGTVTIKDGKGHITIIELSGDIIYEYESQFNYSGGFDSLRDIAFGSNSFYLADNGLLKIFRFDTDWNLISSWNFVDEDGLSHVWFPPYKTLGSIAYDSRYDILYGISLYAGIIQSYTNGGSFLDAWFRPVYFGQSVTDTNGDLWAAQSGLAPGIFPSRLLKFSPFPTTPTLFDDPAFTENLQGIALGSLNYIYVANTNSHTIRKYDSSFNFITEWGSFGTGDSQFNKPTWLAWTVDNKIIVADSLNYQYKIFDTSGNFITKFGNGNGTGNGQFTSLGGVAVLPNGDIVCADKERVQIFALRTLYPSFDRGYQSPSPTTQDETPTVGDSVNGSIGTVAFSSGGGEPTFQLINDTSDGETVWEDTVNGKDLLVEDGVWEEWIETETIIETLEPLDTIDALEEIILPTTDRYDFPGESQQNVTLPLPYGDLTENSDVGVYAAPCIDSVAHVYCVSVKPVLSVANGNTVKVYVDGVLQTSGYTFDESNNYQSQGEIALLDFASDPGGVVTVSCSGVDDGAGNLLTNPVDILEDFLEFAATLTGGAAWQKDIGSFANTKAMAASYNYTCAGVMQSNNSLGYWLKIILKSFLGSYQFDSQGRLHISILPNVQTENIIETIDEHEAITITAKQTRKNLCRRVIMNYAVTFADVDKRFKNGGESAYFRTYDDLGTNTLGEIWNLDIDWTRNTATIENITSLLLALYGDQQWTVSYQGQDFKFLPVDLLDQVTGTFFLLKSSEGTTRDDLIFEIREKMVNLDSFTTTLQLKSINFVLDDNNAYVYLGTSQVTLGGIPITLG